MTKQFNCLKPHPKAVAKWREVGYVPDAIQAHDEQEKFLAAVGAAKKDKIAKSLPDDEPKNWIVISTTEAADRPIKREIKNVYRVKQADGEFMYYVEYLAGETFTGTPYDKHRIVGKYDEPVFSKERDRENGATIITGIRDHVTRYEIPFTAGEFEDPSTGDKTTLAELPKSPELKLYIRTGQDRPYELAGLSLEDYQNRSFEDLMFYAKNNNKWPEAVEAAKKKGSKKDE